MRFLFEGDDVIVGGEIFENSQEPIKDTYYEDETEELKEKVSNYVTTKELPVGIKLKDIPLEFDKDLFAPGNVIEMGSDYTVVRFLIESVNGIFLRGKETYFNAPLEVSLTELLSADYRIVSSKEFEEKPQVKVGDIFKVDHPFIDEYCKVIKLLEDSVVIQIIKPEGKESYTVQHYNDWLKYCVSEITLTASEVEDLVNGNGCRLDDSYEELKRDLIRIHNLPVEMPKPLDLKAHGKIERNYDPALLKADAVK